MPSIYCSQAHENSSDSRFCYWCGEPLAIASHEPTHPGTASPSSASANSETVLNLRYRVIRQLGQGGFGRTYLAEDLSRFQERCVLKEFAPQAQDSYTLKKAEELFEREAGVLYQLQHPQIPRFRELFRVQLAGQDRLFLVQDYVEGQTYQALLAGHQQQGQRFSEPEIMQLLWQLLPVLDYIHSLGVVHRDISPDNLILRSSDHLPVLIDFGGVKHIAATVLSQLASPSITHARYIPPTLLGKVGYSPEEQMHQGVVSPANDLYALGVTMLVLLTGRQPKDLLDPTQMTWRWQPYASLSPILSAVLQRMAAHRPSDRYPSAQAVLGDLQVNAPVPSSLPTQLPPSRISPILPSPVTAATVAVAPRSPTASPVAIESQVKPPPDRHQSSSGLGGYLLAISLLIGMGAAGFWATQNTTVLRSLLNPWLNPASSPSPSASKSPSSSPSPTFSPEETARKAALYNRRKQLGIENNFFSSLVNQIFYAQHSDLQNRQLSTGTEDAALRADWDQTASQLLDQLQILTPEAREQMGTYTQKDRDRWQAQINQIPLSIQAFSDLADAQFFTWFPALRGQQFLGQPMGQIWLAIAADQVKAVQSGKGLETIRFEEGAFDQLMSGTLSPGAGKVYIANLSQDQIMRLSLQAPEQILLSIYTPTADTSPLLKDSSDRTWAGTLTQSGNYEIVLVSTASAPISYQLNLNADNVTSTPPSPELSPSPSPSP